MPLMEVPPTSYILKFDGAARGNPGPGGAGALMLAPAAEGGHVVWAGALPLGRCTNNHAEYWGANLSFRAAARVRELTADAQLPQLTALHCIGDIALVIRQAESQWQLREPKLGPLLADLQSAASALRIPVPWEARPRGVNWQADALAYDAAQRGQNGDCRCLEWWGPDAAARVTEIHPHASCTDRAAAADAQHAPAPEAAVLHERPPSRSTSGWDCIDGVALDACVVSPFAHYDDVPHRFTEAWAYAIADTLELVRDASNDVDLMHAL